MEIIKEITVYLCLAIGFVGLYFQTKYYQDEKKSRG
jgi:hypothetical protein